MKSKKKQVAPADKASPDTDEAVDEEDNGPVKAGIKKTKKLRRSAAKEQAIVDQEKTPEEPSANFGKQVVEGAIGHSDNGEESVTEPEEYSEYEYTDDYEDSGDEYDEYDETYSEPEEEESETESIDNAKKTEKQVEEPSKVVKAKVLKKVDEKSNSAGATGRSELGKSKMADGTEVQVPINHKKIMGHKVHKEFPLKVTIPQKHEEEEEEFKELEDDYYTEFQPYMEDDGITPLSKLNGTSVTIADVLLHDEKIMVGEATFTKKCDSLKNCFVAKCVHAEFDDSRRRFCTIYKNLHLPSAELESNYRYNGAKWLHAASSAVLAAAILTY